MINWIALLTATAWIDFAVIVISKVFPLTKTLSEWYRDFGLVAIGSDIGIIVLGIALAKLLFPMASGWSLVGISVVIQIVHDVLFYVGIIQGVPAGQNKILDIFKRYSAEGSWKILLADSAMVAGSVLLMEAMDGYLTPDQIRFLGLLAVYSLLYILYTK